MHLASTTLILCNRQMEDLITTLQHTKQHTKLADLIAEEDQLEIDRFNAELHQNKQAMLNCRIDRKAKAPFDAFIRAYAINDKIAMIQLVDISVETRKKEEESQKKWINNFESLFANAHDIMNLFSLSQRKILRWNPQAAVSMGFTKEEMENVAIEELYPPEELLKLGATFQKLAENGFSENKLKIYNSKKELRDIWIRSFVVQYEPEILCLVHTIDITDEKEKERRQLKETRLAALGEASASLAHEINNSLQAIQFNLYLVRDEAKKLLPANIYARLDKIENNLAHIESVIRNIQNYTHISETGKSNVFVNTVIESALQILEGYLETRHIEVKLDVTKDIKPLTINSNQVVQILLILIKNACQAMMTSKTRILIISAEMNRSNDLLVNIKDTGCGIPEDTKENLFKNFVTTKPAGVGLGIGLSVASKLARVNDIELSFKSEVDVGSVFTLKFNGAKKETQASKTPSKVLLYVDDKGGLFPSYEDSLGKLNFTVIKAMSAREAIKILMSNRVDMVMCVENLYPISGVEFIKEATNVYAGPMCLVTDASRKGTEKKRLISDEISVDIMNYPCEFDVFCGTIKQLIK
jgi:PAS domain S-box-containing protein